MRKHSKNFNKSYRIYKAFFAATWPKGTPQHQIKKKSVIKKWVNSVVKKASTFWTIFDVFWRKGDKKNIVSLSHVILLKNVIFVVHLILSKKGFQRAKESNTVAINKKKKNIQKFAHTATKVFQVFFLKPIETTMWFSLRCDRYVFFLKTCVFFRYGESTIKTCSRKKESCSPSF